MINSRMMMAIVVYLRTPQTSLGDDDRRTGVETGEATSWELEFKGTSVTESPSLSPSSSAADA